jgi:hypothetical protein
MVCVVVRSRVSKRKGGTNQRMKGCGLVEVAADCYTTPRLAFDGGASARSPLRHLCRDSRPSEASLSARPPSEENLA